MIRFRYMIESFENSCISFQFQCISRVAAFALTMSVWFGSLQFQHFQAPQEFFGKALLTYGKYKFQAAEFRTLPLGESESELSRAGIWGKRTLDPDLGGSAL